MSEQIILNFPAIHFFRQDLNFFKILSHDLKKQTPDFVKNKLQEIIANFLLNKFL